MKIALDYDKTYTLDKDMWNGFIHNASTKGHDIRIVTSRSADIDKISADRLPYIDTPVIYCNGVAKRHYCNWFENWVPDVWIDDKPQNVDNNNTGFSQEAAVKWRASDEYKL